MFRAFASRFTAITATAGTDERGMLGSHYAAFLGFASLSGLMVLSFATQSLVAMTLSILPG